jgi:hypothetical protein
MIFEEKISTLNEYYFFKEFTYSNNKFRKKDGQEIEIADNIISLDEIFIVFQAKERISLDKPSTEKEDTWFEKKVKKKATKQIRDTLQYLKTYDEIVLNNQQGDDSNISTDKIKSLQKIVLFSPTDFLSPENLELKFYNSQTAGIIHIISFENYETIVRTLITPAEVYEYLEFREDLINEYGKIVNSVSEESLLGQYIVDETGSSPNNRYSENLLRLKFDIKTWDVRTLIHLFPNEITRSNKRTDYYYIIREIAKLMRNELQCIKERYILSIESSKKNLKDLPYRIAIPRLDLGFVFIPICWNERALRKNGLTNFTLGHKYEQKLRKCIGATFLYEMDGTFSIEWCYINIPWEKDHGMEKMLQESYPFRKLNKKLIYRYNVHQ